MSKILIIGGTKYIGLELIRIFEQNDVIFYVASRRVINVENFILIDIKINENLNKLFREHDFDIVISFIAFSGFDAFNLCNALNLNSRKPKLILISSVYTYSLPLKIKADEIFNENSFKAYNEQYSLNDRPEVNYSQGKRDMESYFLQNYQNDQLVILRFPIVFGYNDYTLRTRFYFDKILAHEKINPAYIKSKSNFLFVEEAAQSIFNFIGNDLYGTYNVAYEEISEEELIRNYLDYFERSFESLVDFELKVENTPFTCKCNFIIDSSKYISLFPFQFKFRERLFRVLKRLDK